MIALTHLLASRLTIYCWRTPVHTLSSNRKLFDEAEVGWGGANMHLSFTVTSKTGNYVAALITYRHLNEHVIGKLPLKLSTYLHDI